MKYFAKEKGIFAIACVALVGGNLGELAVPFYVGLIIDSISKGQTPDVYDRAWQLILIISVRIL